MQIPILAYHAVRAVSVQDRVPGTVPSAVFEQHVACLLRGGYTGIDLGHAADLLAGRGPPVRRPVVITFDDGYRCVLEHAWPVLRRAGLPATLFVVTGHVGTETAYDARKGGESLAHADWDELARAAEQGLVLGSHGAGHRALAELAPAEAADELRGSRDVLTRRFGRCDHFAYPYGSVPTGGAALVIEAGYRTGCTTAPGLNAVGQPPALLRRQVLGRRSGIGRFHLLRLRRKLGRRW